MKYVRTIDDKIIKIDENGCVKEFNNRLYAFRDKTFSYRFENGREVVKQANTIEELGDWYVGIDAFGKAHFIEATIPFENVKLCFRGMEINMAILTSKGLIYVAKMNDKGELTKYEY